jgi:ParB family chromosome partitioning protein
MIAKRRGLGKGLDALLGTPVSQPTAAGADGQLRNLPIDTLQRGRFQPRVDFRSESLQELADSIRAQGVVQPIIVRPLPDSNRYEIVAGERRWRAAQLVGLSEIPALIRQVSDQMAMSVALIENLQREDLNPIEEATALHRLVSEFNMTHQEVAEAVGRSRAAVSNMLRLLELHPEVKRRVETGELEMGHARAILALAHGRQPEAARQVVDRGLSVRATELLVRKMLAGKPKSAHISPDPDIARLSRELSEKLGAPVSLKHSGKGNGTLVIRYHSLEELEGILSHIS